MKCDARVIPILLVLLALAACTTTQDVADVIYTGGPIVTMVDEGDRAEALAVKDGKILMTGSTDEVMALQGAGTRVVDLAGRALMPGFIDPHSHVVMQAAKFACVNLDPYPIGDVKTIADVQRKLRERIEERSPAPGAVIVGWGYDDTGLEEQRHPNRDDLDAVSEDHAIILIHISSHLMAANSKALELAGIDAGTEDPAGGRIQRRPDSQEPNGVMEEGAMYGLLKLIPTPSPERTESLIEEGLRRYAAEGITTAQDGAAFPSAIPQLRALAESGRMPIDVVAYPVYNTCDDALLEEIARSWKNWGRFRLGGVKLIADGSIQGYTAYLSEPYYKRTDNASVESAECDSPAGMAIVLGESAPDAPESHGEAVTDRGYPGMTQETIDEWLRRADEAGFPLLVHCNGDAATDMLIEAARKVRGDTPRPDLRTTIIHAQVMRDDQLDFAASHGLVPSFFPIHVVFWGDRHRDLFLGPERAARIDPARSALDRGMKITLHHDAPIAHWGMLPVVSAAVNRVTSGGEVLGPDERISAYEAFRAVTADAAWQYFEEDRKGTLEAGKLADMVILDQDPLAVDPAKIVDLRVLETIKEGQTVFRAGSDGM
jgi:predicted amidohydrolase YtcJ